MFVRPSGGQSKTLCITCCCVTVLKSGVFWPDAFLIASSSSFGPTPLLCLPFSTQPVTTDIGESGYDPTAS